MKRQALTDKYNGHKKACDQGVHGQRTLRTLDVVNPR